MLAHNTELRLEVEQIKHTLGNHSKNTELGFQYLYELLEKKEKPSKQRNPVGYKFPAKRR